MAVNGTITKTTFSTKSKGDIITAADISSLQEAITALEGYAKNVDNCGNCMECQKCQACQSCQSQK